MGTVKARDWAGRVWELATEQHGVVSRGQLLELGMGEEAIRHRLANGRLHKVMPGVYAVGRPDLDQHGRWSVAVLACGPEALLSHRSAAALWGIRRPWRGPIEVVVPAHVTRRRPGLRVYRRLETHTLLSEMQAEAKWATEASGEMGLETPGSKLLWRRVDGILVTGPVVTLVDLATCLTRGELEAAVSEADHLDLVDPEELRAALDLLARRPGLAKLRRLLDIAIHVLTTTALERRFLPLVARAGLPAPATQRQLSGNRVDFHWPELGLVVETDSLRYHRTAFKQSADKKRDNANARSGLVTIRFSHGHVRYEPHYVLAELRAVASALRSKREGLLVPQAQ
jgi:hypothetical protein